MKRYPNKKGTDYHLGYGTYLIDGEEFQLQSYNAKEGFYTVRRKLTKKDYIVFLLSSLTKEIRHHLAQEKKRKCKSNVDIIEEKGEDKLNKD